MRFLRNPFLLILVLLASSTFVLAKEEESDDEALSDDGILQRNPKYEKPPPVNKTAAEDESEDEVEGDAKSVLSKTLSKSRKSRRRSLKVLKKNRTIITIAIFLFAFRRELYMLLVHLLGTDELTLSEDGKVGMKRNLKLSVSSILKIVVFMDVMRRIMSGKAGKNLPFELYLVGGRNSAMFGELLTSTVFKQNPSYIPPIEQHYTFEQVNQRYKKDGLALDKAMHYTPKPFPVKKEGDSASLAILRNLVGAEQPPKYNETVIIYDLTDIARRESMDMSELNDKVSFLLDQHRNSKALANAYNETRSNPASREHDAPKLEIIVLLESPGGGAADYGLAAQQIMRLRNEPGIQVTVCVDKVAASGGYMMACTSSPGRLFAAPFALVGSVGVIGSTLNIHNALENWGVKPFVFRGGKHKAPLGIIGEVTDEEIETVQSMIDKTHVAFQRHVLSARTGLESHMEDVATGEVWLGCDAIDVGLVDRVVTSDEYIGERLQVGARVLKLIDYERPTLFGVPKRKRPRLLAASISSTWNNVQALFSKLSTLLNELDTGNNMPTAKAAHAPGLSQMSKTK